MDLTKLKGFTPERWAVSNTAGHEKHGQSAVYDEATGKDIAIVYDGAAHAERIASVNELLELARRGVELAEKITATEGKYLSIEQWNGFISEARALLALAEGGE